MQTLDDILFMQTSELFQKTLVENSDVSTWTKENKEDKYKAIVDICPSIISTAVEFTKQSLQTNSDGECPLSCALTREYYSGVLTFLTNLRNDLDGCDLEELKTLPFDYEWLITKIREVRSKYEEYSNKLGAFTNSIIPGGVEEL